MYSRAVLSEMTTLNQLPVVQSGRKQQAGRQGETWKDKCGVSETAGSRIVIYMSPVIILLPSFRRN